MVNRKYLILLLACAWLAGCGGSSKETDTGGGSDVTATDTPADAAESTSQELDFATTFSTPEPFKGQTCEIVNITLNTPAGSILSKTANDKLSVTFDFEVSEPVFGIYIEPSIYDNENDHFRDEEFIGNLKRGRHIRTLEMNINRAPIEHYRKFFIDLRGQLEGTNIKGGNVFGCNATADVNYFVVE